MSKSADAFRTISEVAEWLDTPAHVLRFWESKFTQVKPVKRAGGRRYYRPADMRLLGGIKKLLHEDGMTIKGAQKILREQGIKHVASLCTLSVGEEEEIDDLVLEEVAVEEPVDTVVPFSKPVEAADPAEPTDLDVGVQPVSDVEADAAPVEQDATTDAPEQSTDQAETAQDASHVLEPSEEAEPVTEPVDAIETVADTPTGEPPIVEPEAVTEAEEASDDAPSLPGFLQRSMDERIQDAEPESEPSQDAVAAQEATNLEPPKHFETLTQVSRIKRLSAASAEQIAPLVKQLRALAS